MSRRVSENIESSHETGNINVPVTLSLVAVLVMGTAAAVKMHIDKVSLKEVLDGLIPEKKTEEIVTQEIQASSGVQIKHEATKQATHPNPPKHIPIAPLRKIPHRGKTAKVTADISGTSTMKIVGAQDYVPHAKKPEPQIAPERFEPVKSLLTELHKNETKQARKKEIRGKLREITLKEGRFILPKTHPEYYKITLQDLWTPEDIGGSQVMALENRQGMVYIGVWNKKAWVRNYGSGKEIPLPINEGSGRTKKAERFKNAFRFPLDEKSITVKGFFREVRFAEREDKSGKKYTISTHHEGNDLRARTGTKVYASAEGKVQYSGWQRGYGWTIVIEHEIEGIKARSLYAHLSKRHKKVGDKVKKGEIIALSGNSGASRGPHLHFEIRVKGTNKVKGESRKRNANETVIDTMFLVSDLTHKAEADSRENTGGGY